MVKQKKSWFTIKKLVSIAITVSVAFTMIITIDQRIQNTIHESVGGVLADSSGVLIVPDPGTAHAIDSLRTVLDGLSRRSAPPSTTFVMSEPSTTIVIERPVALRESIWVHTVFDTLQVETEKPEPLWWDDPRRTGRID